MPPLPNSNMNSMPYPHQSNPNMNPYPTQPNPNMNPYPTQTMPSQAQFGGGFQSPPSYPTSMPSGYPPSSTTVYPSQPPNPYNSNSQFLPPQQQGYSGYGYQQVSSSSSGPSYPIVNNMASCFTEMQGHIKDVRRSKVCSIKKNKIFIYCIMNDLCTVHVCVIIRPKKYVIRAFGKKDERKERCFVTIHIT